MSAPFRKFLNRSEFFKNVLTLFSGTAIAQAVPIVISPILTRIYTPEEFGTLGLFTALIAIFGVISTGKYEFAIMLPKSTADANTVAVLASFITISFGLLMLLIVVAFHGPLVHFFSDPQFALWIYFLPAGIVLTGLFQVMNFYNNREKRYLVIARSRMIRSVVTSGANILLGFVRLAGKSLQAAGLVLGLLLGQLIELLLLIPKKHPMTDKLFTFRREKLALLTAAKRYANFPKFDVPSELMVNASIQLPVLLFNKIFEKSVVGFYFHAHRILSIPMSMLGSAIGQVLYKQLSDCSDDHLRFSALVIASYRHLILLAVIPYSIIGFFGQEVFGLVFGRPWAESGVYAQLIAPWLLFNFVGAPMTMIFSALEKQKKMFLWIIVMFVVRLAAVYTGIHFFGDAYHTVLLFSVSGAIFYMCLNFYLVCIVSRVSFKEFAIATFGWPLAIVVLVGGLGMIIKDSLTTIF